MNQALTPLPLITSEAPVATLSGLYQGHHRWLLAWLERRLGNCFDAQDLAQDTFVRLASKDAFDFAGIEQPRALLRTVAHGLVVNHWRHLDVERACLETLALVAEHYAPTPEQRLQLQQIVMELDALLAGLNPKAYRAFVLAQLEGLNYAQIAAQLQVSTRMVRKYMAQAMLHCLLSDAWGNVESALSEA
ncbi:sigma-70 family RNA polymerase sigma factor [Lampropedia puyangensis]|uniref:Sigma-70 family RNA polymerase sigma factor n=1 Tax=Lampropedia puyangensis TaxID=1330072 RepID=A0A4S8F7R1_9BURK|nr:sigma-70 family RNA polymerase sigma factor [Lampropedia puyangensis]THU02871.1 sigma-70 family RNA polymerase sigma factor [Lampropedia puyangensis]